MPINLEIKAKISNVKKAVEVARMLPAKFEGILMQVDTYFNSPSGRMKLREIMGNRSELIFYLREEESIQRISTYQIYRADQPSHLKSILENAMGVRAIISKKRSLFIYNENRIHIDEVHNLGNFIEFEIPIKTNEENASRIMDFLIQKFEIQGSDFIKGSYVDLLAR